MSKPTLLVDFDGTLHRYTGDFFAPFNEPIPNARAAMMILSRAHTLVCFTSRAANDEHKQRVEIWLRRHGFPKMEVTDVKGKHTVIVDDRAIQFHGRWDDALVGQIQSFLPWWKEGANPPHAEPDAGIVGRPPDTTTGE